MASNSDIEALLPCPFCGASGDQLVRAFTRATDTLAFWSVECKGCGVAVADDESQEHADGSWNTRQHVLSSPAPDEEARQDIERDIRTAIWNAGKWQGKPDEVAQSLIRKAMEEPTMQRALAALSTPAPDAMREALENAYAALRWVYRNGMKPDHDRPADVSAAFSDAFAHERAALSATPVVGREDGREQDIATITKLMRKHSIEAVDFIKNVDDHLEVANAKDWRAALQPDEERG